MTYMKLSKNVLWVSCFMLFAQNGFAQKHTYSWYTTHFPKEHVVSTVDETNIVIEINKSGELDISRRITEEKLLLSNVANSFSNDEIIYSSFYEVSDVDAASYIPKGNDAYTKKRVRDFRTEKAISDNVFHDDDMAIRFQYDDLRPGAKVGLAYTQHILNPFFLTPVFFQNGYFSDNIKVTLQAPASVEIKITEHNIKEGYLSYMREEKNGIITHTWQIDSVPKFDSEPNAPNPKFFIPQISFIIAGYEYKGTYKPVLRNLKDLHAWYDVLLDSVDHALEKPVIEVIDSLKATHTSELALAHALFNWVRGSIKYIAVEDGLGGFIPDNPANVAHKRFGDCKGMSCLLATMMRHAGLNARECWIGTRDIPYAYNDIYSPIVDNHMITAYNHQGKWYFLDPTDEYVPFGYPSSFIQGKEALIGLPNQEYQLENVPIVAPSLSVIGVTDTLTLSESSIYGKAVLINSGYAAVRYKRLYRNAEKKDRFFKYYFESGNDKFTLDGEPVVTTKDTTITATYNYHLPDYAKNFEGKYFVNLNLDRLLADDFLEDRKLPLESDYGKTYVFNHTLQIPKGYKVVALPENFSFDDAFAQVQITYTQSKTAVTYQLKITLPELVLNTSEFEAWNALVKKLRSAYRKSIELQKI